MKAIYKYPLEVLGSQPLALPASSIMLTVQTQREVPCIWAIVDLEDVRSANTKVYTVKIYGTGHKHEKIEGRYLGTFQLHGGGFVGHVFVEEP